MRLAAGTEPVPLSYGSTTTIAPNVAKKDSHQVPVKLSDSVTGKTTKELSRQITVDHSDEHKQNLWKS